MKYKGTNIETFISNTLLEKGITCIWSPHIETLAEAFNINVTYADTCTVMIRKGKKVLIIINKSLSKLEQYEQFLHELGHFFLETAPFPLLSESQWKYTEMRSNYVIQYIAMPLFLLDDIIQLNTVEAVSEYFFVSYELARKRMESIKNRLMEV